MVFLSLTLRQNNDEEIQSHEVDSFIQSFLQYTSDCVNEREFFSMRKLILECVQNNECLDGRNTCEVLESNLNEIIDKSWVVEEGSYIKGYDLNINIEDEELLRIKKGNETKNIQVSKQNLAGNIEVEFRVYY